MNLIKAGIVIHFAALWALADSATLFDGRRIEGECIALDPGWILLRDKAPLDMRNVKSVELDAASIQRLFSTEALQRTLNVRKMMEQLTSLKQPAAQVQQVRNPLAGTWRYESASLSHYEEVVLTLRDDGTYTKRLKGRMSSMSSATAGGEHNGFWKANGMQVHLSGDGNWPAFTHDLRTFQRIQ